MMSFRRLQELGTPRNRIRTNNTRHLMFRRDTVDVGVDYQRIRVCSVYLAGIPGENARHESCVTSLPEINGDLKRRIETVARAPAFAEAIGILITRSAKIARNLGRVITPEDARRLIKLSHFLRRAAGRSMASPVVLLP